ncbi:pyridoxal phosphate-dependent aminotransferase [Betaproteobacteria bacterium]|nr:pyridoxal phosphate-dependent aminotransferase [Betaproteobacteria bacterium]
MSFKINRKVEILEQPQTIALNAIAEKLKSEGKDIINMVMGEPDFDTPKKIVDAATKSMNDGFTHYVSSIGLLELRKKIANKLRVENNISYDPNEILVTPSAKFAIYLALTSFLNDGDEALIIDPSWVSYKALVQLAGAVPVNVPLDYDTNYTITEAVLAKYVTAKTRMIILNTPNNPTGRVFSATENKVLVDFIKKHDLLAVSDEIYETIIFDENKHVALASFPEIRNNVIMINGFSKSHAMTGWRIGYLAAEKSLIQEMLKVQMQVITCTASFVQAAAITAFECQAEVADMLAQYKIRRDYLVRELNTIPGFDCRAPQGTFYVLPRVDYKGMSSEELSEFILQHAQVLLTPGPAYGLGTDKTLRISFATSIENIREAVKRLKEIFV